MNCSNNVKANRTRLEFPSKNSKAKKMRAQYDTLSLASWDSKQSPPHQACWASHLAQYETMNLCCELLCLWWFAATDTGKLYTQNCCYHRNVVISVSAIREILRAEGGVGGHILHISSSYVKSLENMILLTGIVFLGPYLKDEDLIKADNVCNVLYTGTKLETV